MAVKRLSVKTLIVALLILVAVWFLFKAPKSEAYTAPAPQGMALPGLDPSPSAENDGDIYASVKSDGSVMSSCIIDQGVGLSSSLVPREMPSPSAFGQFAPDDILKSQNFLDPRSQIGWPESISGNLRNANHQLRADPVNPKKAYTWMNSTIVPDVMQRNLA